MVKVKYDSKQRKWIELPKFSKEGIYLHSDLKQKLDNIRKIIKKNYDAVILIDGRERIGKSTLGITIGWYLSNETMTKDNICSGLDDVVEKIKNLPDGSVLMVDEGSLVFSSKDAMKKEQRKLMKILDVVGQKNLIFIVCLPCFFDLNKTIALRRSLFLLHVYKDENWNRGEFAYYPEKVKPKLYNTGKKNFDEYLVDPEFHGSFTIFEPPFYDEYIRIKKKSLIEAMESEVKNRKFNKSEYRTELMLKFKENCPDIPHTVIAKGFGISLREFYRRKSGQVEVNGE